MDIVYIQHSFNVNNMVEVKIYPDVVYSLGEGIDCTVVKSHFYIKILLSHIYGSAPEIGGTYQYK